MDFPFRTDVDYLKEAKSTEKKALEKFIELGLWVGKQVTNVAGMTIRIRQLFLPKGIIVPGQTVYQRISPGDEIPAYRKYHTPLAKYPKAEGKVVVFHEGADQGENWTIPELIKWMGNQSVMEDAPPTPLSEEAQKLVDAQRTQLTIKHRSEKEKKEKENEEKAKKYDERNAGQNAKKKSAKDK